VIIARDIFLSSVSVTVSSAVSSRRVAFGMDDADDADDANDANDANGCPDLPLSTALGVDPIRSIASNS